jgi:agmatinase
LFKKTLEKINAQCESLRQTVYENTKALLNDGKLIVLLGGDHSTPLGYVQALAEQHKKFSVLQIDAHADLREAYENFEYSHASIMYNILENIPGANLTQVGIRDYCEEEANYADNSKRVNTFYDKDLKQAAYKGKLWHDQVQEIVNTLENKVYLSFDIDGLDPKLCPNTGTPVAGGFEVEEILYLIEQVLESGRTLIGIDLCEIAPGKDEWDANVGARLLYKLCNLLGKSNGRI